MSEFIGSRISLVSRSDIRYVGTLHEINSETSSVALENVSSFGTEGRKNDPSEEIPPSDSVYEYIVFRGSDVKDLRIEEPPAAKENKPPQIPNDPAILGSGSRPPPQAQVLRDGQQGPPPGAQQGHHQQGGPPNTGPPQYGIPPPFYHPGGWSRGGMPGPNFPGMAPYGASGGPPQGWYPPGGQGFPSQPGPFPPYGYPPPGVQFGQQGQQLKQAPIGPGGKQVSNMPSGQALEKQESKNLSRPAEVAASPVLKAPTPPVSTKPSAAEIKTAEMKTGVAQPTVSKTAANVAVKASNPAIPVGPKINRVQPVTPLATAAATKAPLHNNGGIAPSAMQTAATASLSDATKAATAAVAAAMAKLPPLGTQMNGNAMDSLAKKVDEMRTNDPSRAHRQPGVAGFRGRGRGAGRSGNAKIEVPTTDFDFESSNAKFSKEDLVKEAIAGSPQGTPESKSSPNDDKVPATGYDKATSFFDNIISSEAKERGGPSNARPGGREWRGEEQKKNVETFGQGSVDNGYRGGYRGRGRGRGGFRGRGNFAGHGQPGRGRGSYRGGRSDAQAVVR